MVALGDWLTTREVEKLSGYNIQHIRRLVRTGRVKAQKWGREWMVDRSSLMEFIRTEGRGPQPRKTIDKL